MNVLVISSNPTFGGATTANLKIAETISTLGHETVFNDEFFEGDLQSSVGIKRIKFHWHSHPSHKQIRKEVFSGSYDIMIWGLTVLIPLYMFDIISFHRRGIKQVALFHSLSFKNTVASFVLEWILSKVISKFEALVFVSEYTKNSWCKYSGIKNHKRSVVIYNPIDKPTSFTSLSSTPTMGFVGRLSEEKRPELFMQLSSIDNYQYVVYGAGDDVLEYQQKYPRVQFRGVEKNVDKIYQNIDILILTSRIENCPMVILEAKSRGIPVIAPTVGGISEIVIDGKDGLLFTDFSVERIKSMIDSILNDYSFYSSNCIENSRQFFKEEIAKDWFQLFDSINKK